MEVIQKKGKINNYKTCKKAMHKADALYMQKSNGHYSTNGVPDELVSLYKDALSKTDVFSSISSDDLTQTYIKVAKAGNELNKYTAECYKKYEKPAYEYCKKDYKENEDEYKLYGYRNLDDYWHEWGIPHILGDKFVWEDKKFNMLLDKYYSLTNQYGNDEKLLNDVISKYFDLSTDRLNTNRPETYIRQLVKDLAK